MEIRYWGLLILLGAIWGSAFIFIKVAAPEFGAIPLVQARLIIASLIFVPILLRKKYLLLLKPIWKHSLLLAITNNAIPFTMFSLASFGSESNMLAILNATTAFNTMIIAYFWLKEDVSFKQLTGLILGFIGVIILVNPESSSTSILSAIFCLMGAACYSFSTVFIQKNSAKTNKLVLIGWSIIFSAFLMIPMTLLYLPDNLPSADAFLSVLWLGGVSTGLAFLGYVRLIEKIGAVKTSTVAYFLPIFGIIWGYIFLDEVITPSIIIGCLTILVGVFLATSKKIKKIEGQPHGT
ncbi:MAG: transporter [Gammaproteobacteria bacterium TMED226]|nr:MAG: transporter [Gammaproteobacteria bacterium TMED226]|tara:strand:+ start:5008 stop:5889 length:882 start_codon:yes stop_codon:yes gene_type:complete